MTLAFINIMLPLTKDNIIVRSKQTSCEGAPFQSQQSYISSKWKSKPSVNFLTHLLVEIRLKRHSLFWLRKNEKKESWLIQWKTSESAKETKLDFRTLSKDGTGNNLDSSFAFEYGLSLCSFIHVPELDNIKQL